MSIVSIPQSSALLFDTDSYKVSMPKQYPAGTEIVSSYITSRGGEYTDVMLAGGVFDSPDFATIRARTHSCLN